MVVRKDRRRLDRQVARVLRPLGWRPRPRSLEPRPSAGLRRWSRLAGGVLLLCGGVLGFLPILGFWMVPLGLIVLAYEIAWLQRPVGRLLVLGSRGWRRWRRGPRRAP